MTVCAVCVRTVQTRPRRMAGQPLCHRCFGQVVSIRTATTEDLGARTFYVRSLRWKACTPTNKTEYTVKLIARRYHCTCPDYTHRGVVVKAPCKHVRLVRLLARAAGGLRNLPHGVTLTFRLSDPETVRQRRRA